MKSLFIIAFSLLTSGILVAADFDFEYSKANEADPHNRISLLHSLLSNDNLSDEQRGQAYYLLGYTQQMLGDNLSAVNSMSNASAYYDRAGNIEKAYNSYHALGGMLFKTQSYASAIKAFNEAISLGNQSSYLVDTYSIMAACYAKEDNYDSAILFINRAFTYLQESDRVVKAKVMNTRGFIFMSNNQVEKAIPDFEYAIAFGKPVTIAYGLSNIANCYRLLGDLDHALSYHELADSTFSAIGGSDQSGLLKNLNNKALTQIDLGMAGSAIHILNEIINQETNNQAVLEQQKFAYHQLASIYKNKDLATSVSYLEKAFEIQEIELKIKKESQIADAYFYSTHQDILKESNTMLASALDREGKLFQVVIILGLALFIVIILLLFRLKNRLQTKKQSLKNIRNVLNS